MSLLLPLALFAQVGSTTPMGSAAPVNIAPLPIPRRRTVVDTPEQQANAAADQLDRESDRLSQCLAKTAQDPAAGLAEAHAWLSEGGVAMAQVRANQCLGIAKTDLHDWAGAEQAFAAAVSGIPATQHAAAVPLMAMAGNAAAAGGKPDAALAWFDRALAVQGYPDKAMLGGIEADRSRALVASGRVPDAAVALKLARNLAPGNAEVWLLSATLSRRANDLVTAQTDIEKAAALDPRDSRIALEAGVIAVLAGHDEAARKSWQSVLAVAPGSAEAKVAQGYLDQLAAPAAPSSRQGPERATQKEKPDK